MGLRIAFCGPNIELCDKLAQYTMDRLYNSDADIALLNNPIREVVEVTRQQDWDGPRLDLLNWCASGARTMVLEQNRDRGIVVSGSCSLDQVAVQAAWIQDQMVAADQALSLPSGAMMDERAALYNRSGSVLQVLLNLAEEEIVGYWDFVYAVMPVALGMGPSNDKVLAQYADFLVTVPAFDKIVRIPDNETSAMDALANEVDKWTAKLAS